MESRSHSLSLKTDRPRINGVIYLMDKISRDEVLERFDPDKLNLKKDDLIDFCQSCVDEWKKTHEQI